MSNSKTQYVGASQFTVESLGSQVSNQSSYNSHIQASQDQWHAIMNQDTNQSQKFYTFHDEVSQQQQSPQIENKEISEYFTKKIGMQDSPIIKLFNKREDKKYHPKLIQSEQLEVIEIPQLDMLKPTQVQHHIPKHSLQSIYLKEPITKQNLTSQRPKSIQSPKYINLKPTHQYQVSKALSDNSLESENLSQHSQEVQTMIQNEMGGNSEIQPVINFEIKAVTSRKDFKYPMQLRRLDKIELSNFKTSWIQAANQQRLLMSLQTPYKMDFQVDNSVLNFLDTINTSQTKSTSKKVVSGKNQCYQIHTMAQQTLIINLFDESIQEIIGCFKISGQESSIISKGQDKQVQLNFSTKLISALIIQRGGQQLFRQDFQSVCQDQLIVYIIKV